MNTTLPVPTRYLAVMGVALLFAALFVVARPMLLGDGGGTATPVTPATPVPSPTQPKPHGRPNAPDAAEGRAPARAAGEGR